MVTPPLPQEFWWLLLSRCYAHIILWSWVISSKPGKLSSALADLQNIFSLMASESFFSPQDLILLQEFYFLTFVLSLPTLFPTSFAIIPLGNGFRLRLQAPFISEYCCFFLWDGFSWWVMTSSPFFKLLGKQLMLIVESSWCHQIVFGTEFPLCSVSTWTADSKSEVLLFCSPNLF